MSGHGRGEASSGNLRIAAEVRSVNHRFCRISVRLPPELAFFQEQARRMIQAAVQRGKIDATATVECPSERHALVDSEVAREYVEQSRRLATELDVPGDLDLATLVTLPGVICSEPSLQIDADHRDVAAAALASALEGLDEMRRREGVDLAEDLQTRVRGMSAALDEVESVAADLVPRIREQLTARIREITSDGGPGPDPERLSQEVLFYAERADVTEELVRLRSHLRKVEELLDGEAAVGRTLEFVAQEIHRELSTIGAKVKDLTVADRMVAMKAELERVREQVQNIE